MAVKGMLQLARDAARRKVEDILATPAIRRYIQLGLREVANRYAYAAGWHYSSIRLAAPDGQTVDGNKGTCTHLELSSGRRVLVTAYHVVKALRAGTDRVELSIPQPSADIKAALNKRRPPVQFSANAITTLFEYVEADVCVLEPFEGMAESPSIHWFKQTTSADAIREVRESWQANTSDTTTLPIYALGYPRFAHIKNPAEREEVLGHMPMPVYVRTLSAYPEPRGLGRGGNMSVIVDLKRKPASESEALAAEMNRQLWSNTDSALGGYSGGPLVFAGRNGCELIGIVREGGPRAEDLCFFAYPIDELYANTEHLLERR